jgi:hypothetical protein
MVYSYVRVKRLVIVRNNMDNVYSLRDRISVCTQGMIKHIMARYTSSHYIDIYTRYVDTDILLKITDRVTCGFTHIN